MDYESKIKEEESGIGNCNGGIFLFVIILIGTIVAFVISGINTGEVRIEMIALVLFMEGIGGLAVFGTKSSHKKKKQEMIEHRDAQLKIDEENNLTKIIPQVAINEKSKKIRINDAVYNFRDIVEGGIIEDGDTIVKTTEKKKASVGKAIVGGALFGPAGAIIGGTSGKSISRSTSMQICSKLEVVVTVNNLENPVEYIKIIEKSVNKNSQKYAERSEVAQKCLSVLQIIIDRKNSK